MTEKKKFYNNDTYGLYYKEVMIIIDNSSIINKFVASHTDAAKVVIYDCHMFIVQVTGGVIALKMLVSLSSMQLRNKLECLFMTWFFRLAELILLLGQRAICFTIVIV